MISPNTPARRAEGSRAKEKLAGADAMLVSSARERNKTKAAFGLPS